MSAACCCALSSSVSSPLQAAKLASPLLAVLRTQHVLAVAAKGRASELLGVSLQVSSQLLTVYIALFIERGKQPFCSA